MNFYNLNIKHLKGSTNLGHDRESHASKWLDKENPRAPIFFGRTTVHDILGKQSVLTGRARGEAKEFCSMGQDKSTWSQSIIVTVDEGHVWIYRPCGEICEGQEPAYPDDIPKSIAVQILQRRNLREVPLVLGSMRANQAFSRSTFQPIDPSKYPGNVIAIVAMLPESEQRQISRDALPSIDQIDCLSSVEFETLVAKILECAGCFVPAYKGGFMQHIDLLASNDKDEDIDIGGLVVRGGDSRTIQVKLRTEHSDREGVQADYLISGSRTARHSPFGREWVLQRMSNMPDVRRWLERTTRWADEFMPSLVPEAADIMDHRSGTGARDQSHCASGAGDVEEQRVESQERVVSSFRSSDCPQGVLRIAERVVHALSSVRPFEEQQLRPKEFIVGQAVKEVMKAARTLDNANPCIAQEVPVRTIAYDSGADDRVDLSVTVEDSSEHWHIVIEFDASRADQIAKKFVSRTRWLRTANLVYIACCYPRKNDRDKAECRKFLDYLRFLSEPLGLKGFFGIILE